MGDTLEVAIGTLLNLPRIGRETPDECKWGNGGVVSRRPLHRLLRPGFFVMRADGSGVTSIPIEGVGEAGFPDWR